MKPLLMRKIESHALTQYLSTAAVRNPQAQGQKEGAICESFRLECVTRGRSLDLTLLWIAGQAGAWQVPQQPTPSLRVPRRDGAVELFK